MTTRTLLRTYSTMDVVHMTGATYRQIDWWCCQGLIPGQPRGGTGSGNRRRWTDEQVEEVILLLRASKLINSPLDKVVELLRETA